MVHVVEEYLPNLCESLQKASVSGPIDTKTFAIACGNVLPIFDCLGTRIG